MTKKQHYMTEKERYKLESYLEAGKGVSWIARTMGFCRQTIYNEIKRGAYIHTCDYWDEVRYSADKAQQLHNRAQTAKGRPIKLGNDHALARFLEQKMLGVQEDGSIDKRKRFSPAAALAEARKEGYALTLCVSTIYSYIEKRVFLQLTNKDLWVKSKKKPPSERPERRVSHPDLPSIETRPEIIKQRSEPGHWEMDLVVGKAGTKAALLTLVERVSREAMIFKLPDKKAASVQAVFDRLEEVMPDFRQRFRSITTDNGSEFLRYQELCSSLHGGKRFDIYYCHSYSAWEKGTNENHNRISNLLQFQDTPEKDHPSADKADNYYQEENWVSGNCVSYYTDPAHGGGQDFRDLFQQSVHGEVQAQRRDTFRSGSATDGAGVCNGAGSSLGSFRAASLFPGMGIA